MQFCCRRASCVCTVQVSVGQKVGQNILKLSNDHDQATGSASKRDCHRVDPDGNIRLHRAFSVFLFNSAGDMLLQRRSVEKVRSDIGPYAHTHT